MLNVEHKQLINRIISAECTETTLVHLEAVLHNWEKGRKQGDPFRGFKAQIYRQKWNNSRETIAL